MKITVIGHPNSKMSRITKDLLGQVHVYVNQPPIEGKANKAIVQALADHYHVTRSSVQIVSGESSKTKVVEISGGGQAVNVSKN